MLGLDDHLYLNLWKFLRSGDWKLSNGCPEDRKFTIQYFCKYSLILQNIWLWCLVRYDSVFMDTKRFIIWKFAPNVFILLYLVINKYFKFMNLKRIF